MADEQIIADGYYRIRLQYGYGTSNELSLDASGASSKNGTNVQVYTTNFTDAQIWYITYRGNGAYQILSRFCGKSLDVENYKLENLTNVSLYTDNDSHAQRWSITKTGDVMTFNGVDYPTYYIKLADDPTWILECYGAPERGDTKPGDNVNIYKSEDATVLGDNDTQEDRRWIIEEVGALRAYDEGLFEVHSVIAHHMVWDVAGNTDHPGARLMLGNPNSGNNQKFQFSKYTKDYAIDSWNPSKKVKLDKEHAPQIFEYDGDEKRLYTIQVANSGQYLTPQTIYSNDGIGYFGSDSNIQQLPPCQSVKLNSTTGEYEVTSEDVYMSELWVVDFYGEMKYNGKWCQVIRIRSATDYPMTNGASYYIDDVDGITSNRARIRLWERNQANAELWWLIPTTAYNADIPTVYSMGSTLNVDALKKASSSSSNLDNMYQSLVSDTVFYDPKSSKNIAYPVWRATNSVVSATLYGYLISFRSRKMSLLTGGWSEWSDYTEEVPASVTVTGNIVWYTPGVDISFDKTKYKQAEFQYRVRVLMAQSDGHIKVGPYNSKTVMIYFHPTIEFHTCSWGVQGLRVDFKSNYEGKNIVSIFSIYDNTLKQPIFMNTKSPIKTRQLDADDSFMITPDKLARIPEDHNLTIGYQVGTDQWGVFTSYRSDNGDLLYGVQTATFDVQTDVNHGYNVKPTWSVQPGRILRGTIKDSPNLHVWFNYNDRNHEINGIKATDGTNNMWFDVPYPFGKSFRFYIAANNDDETQWGSARVSFDPDSALFSKYRPAHAWSWTDENGKLRTAVLEMRSGEPLNTNYTISSECTTRVLNSRNWKHVSASKTKSGEFSAEGALAPSVRDGSSVADFEALIDQVHVTYRSSSGRWVKVAVTKISLVEYYQWTQVTVDMTQEGDDVINSAEGSEL